MKQVVQYASGGDLKVEDVPIPALRSGGVLVANRFSLVSAGTERMVMNLARKSLVGKALERPDLVKQVLGKIKTEGLGATLEKVKTKLDSPISLGYSCAGIVLAVAEDVDDFAPGDPVACAGAGYAAHADVVFVPRNLCVAIPRGVDFDEAAYVTLGAIAMQGVRTAEPTLGECVAVIGLGLLGQLTIQILKAAGCRVLGVDIDPSKVDLALKAGCDHAAARGRDDVGAIAACASRGRGVDAVIITAASSSNDPIELAAEILRDKCRVAVVGAVKMDIPRKPYDDKELDVRLSRSYGPGRYDHNYEENGVDYPIGYVRWTERRNMMSFLDLVAARSVRPRELTTHTFDISDAPAAYGLIGGESQEPFLGILFSYPAETRAHTTLVTLAPSQRPDGAVRMGVIGAGGFGGGVILPNLAKTPGASLLGICTRDGVKARRAAERFGAELATTDPGELIEDSRVDAVVIATRHDMHPALTTAALRSGKQVFVEKPLAIDEDGLEAIVAARAESGHEVVVDFNRRFAPLAVRTREMLASGKGPLVMVYRVNAGLIPTDHWVHDPREGGGRIVGEACHFIDLMQFLCGAKPIEVHAVSASGAREDRTNHDNSVITIKYADGSVGTLAYAAEGDPRMPKERIEVLGRGISAVIDDFRSAVFLYSGKSETVRRKSQDKGHAAMMAGFVDFVAGRCDSPVPFDEAVATTRATFAALQSIGTGASVALQ